MKAGRTFAMLNDSFQIRRDNRVFEFNPVRPAANPGTAGSFGSIEHWGPGWSAQFFVGLSVKGVPTFTAEQIRDLTLALRREQIHGLVDVSRSEYPVQHGGSVTPKLGWWEKVEYGKRGGVEAKENSVSVEITDLPGEDADDFKENMHRLAMLLAVELRQEAVVAQLANAGVVQQIFEARP